MRKLKLSEAQYIDVLLGKIQDAIDRYEQTFFILADESNPVCAKARETTEGKNGAVSFGRG